MSVYFDNRINISKGTVIATQCHDKLKRLAVASFDSNSLGTIQIYETDTITIEGLTISKPCSPLSIQWHPTKLILAVGWETGEACMYNETEKTVYEFPLVHKSDIRIIDFNGNGIKVISADSAGTINVWKLDVKGKPQQAPMISAKVTSGVTSILLRPIAKTDDGLDISALAKLAVSGDEKALDLLSWHNKTGKGGFGPSEANSFFVGSVNGCVYYLDENGRCQAIFDTDGAVKKLLYHQKRNILVTVTDNGVLTQHSVGSDGTSRELTKFKLSSRCPNPDVIWAGKNLLAMAMGESMVRFWDVATEDNFTLTLDDNMGYEANAQVNSIAYSPSKKVLIAGTQIGQLAVWGFQPVQESVRKDPEDDWRIQPPINIQGNASQLRWGAGEQMLTLNAVNAGYIITQQPLNSNYRAGMAVVQTGPVSAYLANFTTEFFDDIRVEQRVKNLCTSGEHLVIWDGKQLTSYEYSGDKAAMLKQVGQFPCDSPLVEIFEQNLYTLEPLKIQVRTLQGTVKQLLSFADSQGSVSCMHVNNKFLACATTRGHLKLFDLSRREAKQVGGERSLADAVPRFHAITSVNVNASGSCVTAICQLDDLTVDSRIYLWDVEMDTVTFFDLTLGQAEHDHFDPELDRERLATAKDLSGRIPTHLHWDANEPRLLIVEAKLAPVDETLQDLNKNFMTGLPDEIETMIICLFYTDEFGFVVQDSFALHPSFSQLLSVDVPYFYFGVHPGSATRVPEVLDKSFTTSQKVGRVARRTMRDFVGLEECDKNSKEAMMDFSFYLTIGNMDEAFKAMKLIKSESVWQNMARMCVKSRRLDVVAVCLGKMGHARGAMMMRQAQAQSNGQAEVTLAMLALQIGMNEEGERLLKNAKRYDLLNAMYRSQGRWGQALDIAEKYDRIHIRVTHHEYAQYLERNGDTGQAIEEYILAETHRTEVPRMLCDYPHQLEEFVRRMQDHKMNKWFAQYLESMGNMVEALEFYRTAKDFLSIVRIYCHLNQIDEALEICNNTGNPAACFHIARHLEQQGDFTKAIHYFSRAQAISSAVRLCRTNGLLDQLVNLALLGKPDDMIEAARFLEREEPTMSDKAILLYHKAGQVSRAVDLAFRSRQFGALEHISHDLDQKTDPALLQQCAKFFLDNNQFDRAVGLLAAGKQFKEGIRLCSEQNVPISEELAESLTPDKGEVTDSERLRLLEEIAEVCFHQRNYHTACKKFTQAGNREKAMKCLLKSGDTEKIIFFANVSKQKEIYVMAANYLQSANWQQQPEIMKSIVQFYTKGRAHDSLASFYESCARNEISEYQNYEKAQGALLEAYKALSKGVENGTVPESKLVELKDKATEVKKFITIKQLFSSSTEEALKHSQELVESIMGDSLVRQGDVFACMVTFFASKEKYKAAYACIEDMKARLGAKTNLTYYIPSKTLDKIHKALNIPFITPSTNGVDKGHVEEEEDEDIGEFVEEAI